MKVELCPEITPNTVRNFLSLIKKGSHDGTIFHRMTPGFVIQDDDSEGADMGGPDYRIRGEFTRNGSKNDLKHIRGMISMTRASHPDSAGSQSLLMVGDAPYLDDNYATLGEIIEGPEEADRIVEAPRGAKDRPREDRVIKKVIAETFGVEYEEPETLPP